MNNVSSLEQKSKTKNLDVNLSLREYKIDLMPRFMEIISKNLQLTQKPKAPQLGNSDSTIETYRGQTNIRIPYKRKSTIKK